MIEYLGIPITLLLSIFMLFLCTTKKKKNASRNHVEVVKYSHRPNDFNSFRNVEEAVVSSAAENGSASHVSHAVADTQSEPVKKHSGTTVQTSQDRELPQPPPSSEVASSSQRNSADVVIEISKDAASGGDGDQAKNSSPKGRRLPAPPPEDSARSSSDEQRLSTQDDEDPYASVDDGSENLKKPSETIRLQIKTLDIVEGSSDSTFYAKVADVAEEESDLYAQVEDKTMDESDEEESTKVFAVDPSEVPSTSTAAQAPSGSYASPEYASIDRVKKAMSIKKKSEKRSTSSEPPAPPIPDRNFDDDEEEEEEEEVQDANTEADVSQDLTDDTAPMYDKLCVRESLDHLRKREEVEKERRERYENLPCITGVSSAPSDDYAQIEENNGEAVYESLSQPGSADGTFIPGAINPDYSSIGELNLHPPTSQVADGDTDTNLHRYPRRQHHYEQIQQTLPT